MIESLTGYTQEEFITTLFGCIAMILISVTMCGLAFLIIYLVGKMEKKEERMKAYKCDRCRKYYEDDGREKKYYITAAPSWQEGIKDLCPECQRELNDFMELYTPKDRVKSGKENEECKEWE